MNESERALLRRISDERDAEAFSLVMGQYSSMVYGACRRVLRNDSQAADVTQETFFQFLLNADRVTSGIAGWLHRVATHRAVDLLRQNASRRRREETYAREMVTIPESWQQVEPVVDEALDELPDDARELLILHYLNGQSMAEIAAAQGCSQPTISRRMGAALGQLRERLREKDVPVKAGTLGGILVANLEASVLPPALLKSLGKLALMEAAAATGLQTGGVAVSSIGVGAKIAAALATAALVTGVAVVAIHRSGAEPPAVSTASSATGGGAGIAPGGASGGSTTAASGAIPASTTQGTLNPGPRPSPPQVLTNSGDFAASTSPNGTGWVFMTNIPGSGQGLASINGGRATGGYGTGLGPLPVGGGIPEAAAVIRQRMRERFQNRTGLRIGGGGGGGFSSPGGSVGGSGTFRSVYGGVAVSASSGPWGTTSNYHSYQRSQVVSNGLSSVTVREVIAGSPAANQMRGTPGSLVSTTGNGPGGGVFTTSASSAAAGGGGGSVPAAWRPPR